LPVSQVSSVAFGGEHLDVLYVTTSRQRMSDEALAHEPLAGTLLAVDPGVKGLPEPRFDPA
jgi:sugar lactone lactonase YvrE